MLNDQLEDEDIVYQIKEMQDKGIYAFIARTYIGLKSDYPGENFMSKMKLIIETAEKYGIKVLLQARYMPEAIPDLDPNYALDFLRADKGEVPDGCELLHNDNGINISRFNSQTFLDLFDEESVDKYIDICYSMWDRFKKHFGKTVISVWVDEPSYSAEYLPYPKKLEEEFINSYGYDLREKLHLLYVDEGDYKTVRWQYRTLIQDMMERAYFAKIKEWCNKNNLWFSGHLMMEETIKSQQLRAAATMPFYSYFDLPGIDVLLAQLNWRENEIKPPEIYETHGSRIVTLTTPLQLASAAAQAGQEHMLCEMYGVSSQNLSFRDQKHIFDTYACYGINHRAIHGSFYSLGGRRKRAYPPHINYYQPYWDEFGEMTEAVVNTSKFVTEGKRSGKVLVIHPMGSGAALFPGKVNGGEKAKSEAQLDKLDGLFVDLISRLTASHIQFDLGDERIIERDGYVSGDRLMVGKCEYDTIVMPYLTHIRKSTADFINLFIKNGGKVFALDSVPMFADGAEIKFNSDIQLTTVTKLVQQLRSLSDFSLSGEGVENVRVMKRETSKGINFFILNFDCSAKKEVTLSINGFYRAFITDSKNGKIEEIPTYSDGVTSINLTLEEGASVMLSLTDGISEVAPQKPATTLTVPLNNSWHLNRLNNNVFLLEFCRFKKGNEDFSIKVPVLAVQDILVKENYCGPITLEFEFESSVEVENAKLALENAEEWAVNFNGEPVKTFVDGYYLAKQFKTISIPKIKRGINKVTICKDDYIPLARARKAINSLFEYQRGDELECCYIIGDFAVSAEAEACLTGNTRYSGFAIDSETHHSNNEISANGYPFYAGKIELTQEVCVDAKNPKRVVLKFDSVNAACGRVFVNGNDCGLLMWNPYEIDITKQAINGTNKIKIVLSSSLRNLLGPYHRPHGEIGNLFGGSYANPNLAWNGTDKQISNPKWYEDRVPDTQLWCESYMQTKFGLSGGRIIVEY